MPPGAQAEAVAIQGDGKIVAAGRTGGDVALARYLPGGTLDPTFGDVGRVITSLGGDESASGIALQGDETLPDDGRIVIAGKTSTGDGRFLLARYHAGDFDTTPPDTGIISSPADPTNDPEPSFGLGSSEPGSSFERELDGAGFEPCSSPHALGPLSDGEHTSVPGDRRGRQRRPDLGQPQLHRRYEPAHGRQSVGRQPVRRDVDARGLRVLAGGGAYASSQSVSRA